MLKVEMTNRTANPFYGMRSCLELYQNASKGIITHPQLNACYNEVRDSKEAREMFFSLLFSIGDITARQHNLFPKGKTDSGGNAQKEAFITIMNWLKGANYSQFRKFLFANLFNEYVSFDVLLMNRVKTTKGKKKVEKVVSSLSGNEEYLNDLSDFVARVITGSNPSHKHFLAKFLTRPRLSKRKGHKMMLPETREIMKAKENFLVMVSEKANLPVVKKATYYEFPGYFGWRKEYIGDLESVLFSSGKVKEFDKSEFLDWLNKMPAGARYRVRRRLLDKNDKPKTLVTKTNGDSITGDAGAIKWPSLGEWFLEWEKYKDTKQGEQRVIEEKVRQGTATEADITKLATVKKEAKVTVGAVKFADLFKEIVMGTVDKVKIQPFLDKINLPYNNLVFIDDSGSMRSNGIPGIPAFDFATFMATIMLTKNPDDVGRALLGFFSTGARLYGTMTSRSTMANTLMRATVRKVNEPLIVPEEHFLDNLKRIREFGHSVMTANGTNISSVPDYLHQQLKADPSMLEQLQAFPVWTMISDGNWNNMPSPEASMNDFMKRCQAYFGFKPFIIAIDVQTTSSASVSRFSGIDNFMFIPPNPAQIEQLLTNFKDMDVMDVYTPLQSLHRSNRYEPVRKNTI